MTETTIVRDTGDYLPLGLPESEGVYIKVLRVVEEEGRAVAKIKFDAGASAPRHNHYCRAVAHTLSGSWAYDEGRFEVGDTAVEPVGNNHQPWSDEGTEMLIVFDTDNGLLLDNFLSDGTVIRFGLPLLAALEGKSLAEMTSFDPSPYLEIFGSEAELREVV